VTQLALSDDFLPDTGGQAAAPMPQPPPLPYDSVPLPDEPDSYADGNDDGWFATADDWAELGHPDDMPGQHMPVDLSPGAVPAELLAGLNPDQVEAVRTLEGPLLVVAGPGSGKTRVLTHRSAALLRGGVPAWRQLAVTFTNKAAGEMRDRLEQLVGAEASRQMWVATFHSMCARILRANAEAAGLGRDFTIVDSDDSSKLLAAGLERAGQGKLERKELRSLRAEISRAKNEGRTIAEIAARGPADRLLAAAWTYYEQELERVNGLDFDDLMLRCLRLLETDAVVRERYQQKFSHVSVDEAQDTNFVQWRLIQILAAGHGNVMLVGDADQSIYRFRAADPSFMAGFAEEWTNAKVVVLHQNYRSTANILDVVRAVIAPNEAPNRPALTTDAAAGAPVKLYIARDDRDEASWVCRRIAATPGSHGAHAILVRTHAQTRVLEEALKLSGLPYDLVGMTKFYDRAEVKDALSYLRAAVNPRDAIAFRRALTTPKRGIGPAMIDAIDADAADGDVVAAARRAATGRSAKAQALAGFLDVLDAVRDAAGTAGPAAALNVAIRVGGVKAMYAKDADGHTRVENMQELVNAAAAYVVDDTQVTVDGTPVPALPADRQTVAFLENVALVAAGDDVEDGGGRVQVITAHASKGKEFGHVYVVGVEDGFFPYVRSTTDDEIAEERRLLFVACSRAERTLTLSRARQRVLFGGSPDVREPSPFLVSLPDAVQVVKTSLPPKEPAGSGYRGGSRGGGWTPRTGNVHARKPGTSFTRTSGPVRAFDRPVVKPTSSPDVEEVDSGAPLSASQVYEGLICRHPDLGMVTVERYTGGLAVVRSTRLNTTKTVLFTELTAL
jgi:DNA helicase-2/ATP-dependent DNA helicase PcrA